MGCHGLTSAQTVSDSVTWWTIPSSKVLFFMLLADLGQGPALAIGQSHTACDPIPKDAVLGHQIFVPQQQLLIDGPCDVREQRFSAHTPLHLRFFCPYEREV
jgi:hypothetical protein